jgi:hypothetical protein
MARSTPIADLRYGIDRFDESPFDRVVEVDDDGATTELSDLVQTYDWVQDDGYRNFGDWVEEAAAVRGR